jgi:hypothetical protein
MSLPIPLSSEDKAGICYFFPVLGLDAQNELGLIIYIDMLVVNGGGGDTCA